MTNLVAITTSKLLISSAYKYVALAVMLVQANHFTETLHLNDEHLITVQDLKSGGHVSPPRLMGFGGSLLTTNCFFGFSDGRLNNFKKIDFLGEDDSAIRKQLVKYSTMKSAIDTNEACQIARNWLAALSIDVTQMEKKYPLRITQWEFAFAGTGTLEMGKRPLPIFKLDWGGVSLGNAGSGHNLPALTMTIFGPTKELVEFHMLDDAFVSKPKILLADSEKLLAIPNATFNGFSDMERSNLVLQFTGAKP